VRKEYAGIDRPVLLIYGEHDWSTEAEREANRRDVPGNESVTLPNAGHFVSVEAPRSEPRTT
jgi:pimeloyl-ACP methyl ester carboxylesterase